MHALGFGSECSVRGRVRELRGCEEGPPRIDRPGRLTGRKGVARPAWPGVSRIVRAPFQLWRKMLTAALHFLVASGQPTAHVTRPAFSMPAVSLPLMSHALLSACQRSGYRSCHTPCFPDHHPCLAATAAVTAPGSKGVLLSPHARLVVSMVVT